MRAPPVPAARTGWSVGHPGLVWVHTGQARVDVDGAGTLRLAAGEGLWVPADRRRRISTAPGTVAFPYAVPPQTATGPPEPVRFEARPEWHDWLIQHYLHFVAPVSSFGYSRASLLDVVGARGPEAPPPLPLHGAARAVAEELARDPALDHTVEQWAGLVACSPRTLHRDFVRGTGLTFARWRTACRLSVACDLLAEGAGIDRVAVRTGFASRNGFARAFGRHYGLTPREYRAWSRRRDTGTSPSPRSGLLTQVLGEDRPLPATQTPPHANAVHLLAWMYRGSGYLRIDGRTHHLARGDAIWIPAGREHRFGTHTGSIALPLGHVDPGRAQVAEPLRTRFPPSWDAYLLHSSVSSRTPLRPAGHDPDAIGETFHRWVAAGRARSVHLPRDPRARAAAEEFLRGMREPSATDPAVHEAFRRETGTTFARWRHAVRMQTAGELLTGGATPSSVARQLGYSRLSNFSRAFSTFHGESPRDHLSRGGLPRPAAR